ncbi:hypothetical protein NMY22_g17320 [Coprinellus aureogranulatus]|nr:hypothetical protein NMY22_g17320 [Coprinellus aureogranulatus]
MQMAQLRSQTPFGVSRSCDVGLGMHSCFQRGKVCRRGKLQCIAQKDQTQASGGSEERNLVWARSGREAGVSEIAAPRACSVSAAEAVAPGPLVPISALTIPGGTTTRLFTPFWGSGGSRLLFGILMPRVLPEVTMLSLVIALVASLLVLYTYHAHLTLLHERGRKDSRDAEYNLLVRENQGLHMELVFVKERNEGLENKIIESEAGAAISRSIMAGQAEEIVQLRAQLRTMESKNKAFSRDKKALADQSQKIVRLTGDLARMESDCRWKDQQILNMGKDNEALKDDCIRYETRVLELSDKLSECHTLLSRSSRTGDWIMASSHPPAYHESTGRSRVPTRKPSRPSTDPNKTFFDTESRFKFFQTTLSAALPRPIQPIDALYRDRLRALDFRMACYDAETEKAEGWLRVVMRPYDATILESVPAWQRQ